MKQSALIGFACLFFVALSALGLLAQNSIDDKGDPNNPVTNPRANACYVGGSLDGTCSGFQWKWVCGWGIIRVEEGLLNRAVLSAECQALMPALEPTYTPQPVKSKATAVPTLTEKPPKSS